MRMTKWGPIVYSAVTASRILRMALHPVLDSEAANGPGFGCRAVWTVASGDYGWRWNTSCRGSDSTSIPGRVERITRKGPVADADTCPEDDEDNDGDAIKWLLEGEGRGAREQRRQRRRNDKP